MDKKFCDVSGLEIKDQTEWYQLRIIRKMDSFSRAEKPALPVKDIHSLVFEQLKGILQGLEASYETKDNKDDHQGGGESSPVDSNGQSGD